MNPADPHDAALANFRQVVAADPLNLDAAALAVAAVLQPGLDAEVWLTALDELAASCPAPSRDGVVRHLFAAGRFTGDTDTYSHWRNSCLDHVIGTGHGIPITLSIVTIEVARRVGVTLTGVGMPAHFLVGDPNDGDWFLDAFHQGRVLDREGCADLFARIAGSRHPWRGDAYLQPTPTRAIVVRLLNNLKAGFTNRGDPLRLALVMRMRQAMPEITGEGAETIRAIAILN